MRNLVGRLDESGEVEEDDGTWGALVFLAAKPHHKNLPWHKYRWILRVFYQKLNQVTRPFPILIPYCDDTVQEIDTQSNYFIVVDMDSEYWQVVVEEEAR